MSLNQSTLLSVGQVRPNPRWAMPPHQHPFHELIVVVDGAMRVSTPLASVDARPGDLLFYTADMTHEERSDARNPVQTYFISFTWDGNVPDIPLRCRDANERIGWLIRWLYAERYSTQPSISQVRAAILQTILAEYLLLIAYEEPGLVAQIRQFIRAHIHEPLSVERLAEQANMSKFHFIRSYKKLCGRTPVEDIRYIRVEAVRDLLLTTNYPLKAIAPRVGVANEHHLSRLVRQYSGMTPGELRRRVTWKDHPPQVEEYY